MATSKNKAVKYAVLDAFTESAFKGNPAAVCVLEEERDEKWMQSLATEFNLSETCYLIRMTPHDPPRFHLRWFTSKTEVKLCGHATLAAAHFCFTSGLINGNIIEFSTLSGILIATKVTSNLPQCQEGDQAKPSFLVELDFPVVPFADCTSDEISSVSKAIGDASLIDVKKTIANDFLFVLPSAKVVTDFKPQFEEIRNCPSNGMIITAPGPQGSGFDFFSRYFCPNLGTNEDPVTGSVHCAIALYWQKQLGKCNFRAYQASQRGGVLQLRIDEQANRVKLQGNVVTVMEGSIIV